MADGKVRESYSNVVRTDTKVAIAADELTDAIVKMGNCQKHVAIADLNLLECESQLDSVNVQLKRCVMVVVAMELGPDFDMAWQHMCDLCDSICECTVGIHRSRANRDACRLRLKQAEEDRSRCEEDLKRAKFVRDECYATLTQDWNVANANIMRVDKAQECMKSVMRESSEPAGSSVERPD